ncbi:hypothetical protein GCM10022225_48060 [Plantactinospora mayteni]|uniref:Uncharacterized protein n=1 Tax=Plantactinospora mayteni TaxID=566021 RepID=A0ABQ4ESQ4_9ACTN|nr:hypothetical protein Pma05_42560 [Plantactinospora mayteni]
MGSRHKFAGGSRKSGRIVEVNQRLLQLVQIAIQLRFSPTIKFPSQLGGASDVDDSA